MKEIPTKSGHKILVDDDVYEWASLFPWHIGPKGYVVRRENEKWVFLHRLIIDCPKGMMTDHANGNRIDNRRENLRVASARQNAQNKKIPRNNTSGYKGIHLEDGKYRAFIHIDGKKKSIGRFETAEEAARAYDEKAREIYGKFARTNFKP